MARDSLQTLLVIRRLAVEQARGMLAECRLAEASIAARIEALDALAQRDRAAEGSIEAAYQFQPMFARRRLALDGSKATAKSDLAAAALRSEQAHAAVVAARTDLESVETLIAERAAARDADGAHRAQHALDDLTRSLNNPAC